MAKRRTAAHEPETENPTLDARHRLPLRLQLQAAELITEALSSSDAGKRESLLAEARALIAKADEQAQRNGDQR